jgi:hypothetical protein
MVSAISFACLNGTTDAFSFATRPPLQCVRPGQLKMHDNGDVVADEEDYGHIGSRRGFFSKVSATTAPILFAASEASAVTNEVTNEPTRIELSVDTEYLIRVLEYFDGDMRKVLGVLVRSPQTTVEIEPPATGKGLLDPKDAILRALYSYKSPDDYATQASWVKVDEPDKGWVEFLTKKRYRIYLPSISSDGNDENGKLDVTIQATNINLSNLEGGVGLAVLSYPVAYGYYKYESWWEEQEMKERKAKIAAKNAAKAGAAKKAKGTPNAEIKVVKAEGGMKPPPLKGQAKRKDGPGEKSLPTKKAKTANSENDDVFAAIKSIEDQVAGEMLDSQRANIVAATEKQHLEQQAELQSNEVEENSAAIEQQWLQTEIKPQQDVNEMDQLIAAAVKLSESKKSAPGGGYLDKLSIISPIDATPSPQPMDATGYLDNLTQNIANSGQSVGGVETSEPPRPYTGTNLRSLIENAKPKRGLSNSYLDSL